MERMIRYLIVVILVLCAFSFVKVASYYADYLEFRVEAEYINGRSGL